MADAHSTALDKFDFQPAHWINGRWLAAGTERLEIRNPATAASLATLPLADAAQFAQAVDGAHAALAAWRDEAPSTRGDILKRIAATLTARRSDLATLLTSEQGKPLSQALGEVDYAASFFLWFGEEARRLCGRLQPHPVRGREYQVRPVAAGVAGLVTPWNFPLAQGAKKLAAALAAGCTAVWKPSEFTPLVALVLGPIFKDAGLPDGVVQILPARGPVAGTALTGDARVRVLSLTGSTQTGQTLMRAAAQHLPRLSFELGGNAPFIVLPDADLNVAAAELTRLKLLCAGQVCVTADRIFFSAHREADFAGKLAALWEKLRVGNGLVPDTDVGPLIHAQACARVQDLVDEALAAGAKRVVENVGHRADPSLARGSFFPPTVLRGVRDEMAIACNEIFGPVAALLSYTDIASAVQRANATPFGLAAYVYGTDLSVANGVAQAIEAGIIGVNEWRPLRAEIPFGGIKASGLGHEGGTEGLLEFCELKVIATSSPAIPPPTA